MEIHDMSEKIRIMMVEDHPDFREVVELAVGKEADMEITGQFGTSERALGSLRDLRSAKIPHVILLDLNLPGMNGMDAIRFFKDSVPDAHIVILTQSESEEDVLRAIALGADGYLLKSSSLRQLIDGIRTVGSYGAIIDKTFGSFLLRMLRAKLPKNQIGNVLTDREIETLSLVAAGLSKKEISDQMGISVSTVVTHVAHTYEKLRVKNAPAAVSKAFHLGILPAERKEP